MTELAFKLFDADNHYYEATDAFTRHLPKEYAKRGMQWAEVDGKLRLLVAGAGTPVLPRIPPSIPSPSRVASRSTSAAVPRRTTSAVRSVSSSRSAPSTASRRHA